MNKTIEEFNALTVADMREYLASLKPGMHTVLGKEGIIKSRDTRLVMSQKYASYLVMNVDKIRGETADSIIVDEAQHIDPVREAAKVATFGEATGPYGTMIINTGLDQSSMLMPAPETKPMNRGDVVKKMVSQIVPTLLKIKQLPKPYNRKQARQYDHVVRPVRKALARAGITLAEALAAV